MGARDWLRFGGGDGNKYDLGNLFNPNDIIRGTEQGFGNIMGMGDESEEAKQKRAMLNDQGRASSDFAAWGESGYHRRGNDLNDVRSQLKRYADGQDSVSREMLRQGAQQNYAAQRSMAAGAAPSNATMAARTAANNMNRTNYGMSGQAAVAGMQERQAAAKLLADVTAQQRQQELQAALGSRQNAVNAYGGGSEGKTGLEKAQPAIQALMSMAALSDERAKTNIQPGESSAEVLGKIQPHRFRYIDEKHGKGSQYGVMAQALERAGLGHVVIDTPEGKMIDGGKLATTTLALLADVNSRLEKLEGKR
jgi:hypothetical protein